MIRARAGIAYPLAEAMSHGHCGLAEDELLVQAEKLLEILSTILAEALRTELATSAVIADSIEARRCIFLAHLWRAEKFIAHRLRALIHERPPWPAIDAERALGWVEKKFGLTLAASQRAAVALALANKLVVVTGGPGVGKTTPG
jgi:exodeoxyribonuclease V alpha subunit